ncbi:DNA helicase UvrD [Candidatus Woesearchaeota archaeon]|nr:DNA helicase UvrD [Candidatus Woesearchaeota archaeon]
MIIADLHMHGKYSRATSKDLVFESIERYAKLKGLSLVGTGDFTHPKWREEIGNKLHDDGRGILTTNTGFPFLLQTEISLIYKWNGRGRKIHNVVLAPSLDVVDQITEALLKRGRVDYDGRPIFGIPCPEFVEMMHSISKDIEVIPAHAWTPWFGVFGSESGFDSLKECFEDQAKNIHAIETGISSTPAMNWRIPELDEYSLVSFSDSHSYWPWRMGREATLFDCKMTYKAIVQAIRNREIMGTIETDPAYGKYHIDGHRACDVRLQPAQSRELKKICPKCKKGLTIGVLHRIEELATREDGYKPRDAKPFYTLLPLHEVIANVLQKGLGTKAVQGEATKLLGLGSELNILMHTPLDEIEKHTTPAIAQAVAMNRLGKVPMLPGYDGEYGIPLFTNTDEEKTRMENYLTKLTNKEKIQLGLSEFY